VQIHGSLCPASSTHVYHQLEAIKQTKVDMQVYLGNYNVPNDNDASYDRQKTVILQVIQDYGDKNIAGITVGNEYILKWATFLQSVILCDSFRLVTFSRMAVARQMDLLVIKAQHYSYPTSMTCALRYKA
jgi:exo-beta-1,3-glucanase (GH17 family)